MKKIIGIFLICFVSFMYLTNCATTPKVTDISGPTEIIEHKGTVFGIAQPDWVSSVIGTPNQKTLSKALGIEKHIWVVTKNGENLDFIKTWADQVDARAEISASINQGISDFVGATMQGDKAEVEEAIERYSARASAITVSGLTKETDSRVNKISLSKMGHEVSKETIDKIVSKNKGRKIDKDKLLIKTTTKNIITYGINSLINFFINLCHLHYQLYHL